MDYLSWKLGAVQLFCLNHDSLLSARDNGVVSEATKNSGTNALPSHKLLDKKSIREKALEKTLQALLIDIPRQVCDDFRLS